MVESVIIFPSFVSLSPAFVLDFLAIGTRRGVMMEDDVYWT